VIVIVAVMIVAVTILAVITHICSVACRPAIALPRRATWYRRNDDPQQEGSDETTNIQKHNDILIR
jgi:hypothetical protein